MNLRIRCNSIAAFVLKKERGHAKHLLIRRAGKRLRGHWQMVAGKIEKRETAWQAALREIGEETGLKVRELYAADTLELFYSVREDLIDVTPVFVAVVDAKARVRLSDEHDAFAWLTAAQAAKT
ncbi:MAG: NUDIX domain-containing protein [Planctomycetes bacterium]|nr:NUDIX domain-containing protein [Planctomycetota bacterium]